MGVLVFLRRRWPTVVHDLAWVPLAILVAFWVRHNLGWIPGSSWPSLGLLVAVALPIHAATYWATGCFRGFWRFASIPDLIRFVLAIGIGGLTVTGVFLAYFHEIGVPRAVFLVYPLILLLGVVGVRIAYRMTFERLDNGHAMHRELALIVGAGQAGNLLIRDLLVDGPYRPVGILDDDPSKTGSELHGVRVVGRIADVARVAQRLGVRAVLIAMPSAPRDVLNNLVRTCADLGIQCRSLPSLVGLAHGRVQVSDLRPVTVDDLLGRDPIRFDGTEVESFIAGKSVLVTGGGGSIGSELCRQIARLNPGKLVVLESSEFNLYRIDAELRSLLGPEKVISRLGDCKDRASVDRLMNAVRPHLIFHAAAYKHVPLLEDNIIEGVSNNVVGTQVVADAAIAAGVETFVLVSTDKTVNPTSWMGASKRVAELYCQSQNRDSGTHFITTRFGNVLASAGSVVPLFEDQIRKGGPVTVTHPDIARYFMTIPEAVSLILQAGSMGRGGEIFVLDMGEQIRIRDLAEKMIQLSGLQPGRDIEIQYTGLRPGEKLFEELFHSSETLGKTAHPKLLLANSRHVVVESLNAALAAMRTACTVGDIAGLYRAIMDIVPEFKSERPKALKSVGQSHVRVVK